MVAPCVVAEACDSIIPWGLPTCQALGADHPPVTPYQPGRPTTPRRIPRAFHRGDVPPLLSAGEDHPHTTRPLSHRPVERDHNIALLRLPVPYVPYEHRRAATSSLELARRHRGVLAAHDPRPEVVGGRAGL